MKDILEDILAHKRVEVAREKRNITPKELYSKVESQLEDAKQENSYPLIDQKERNILRKCCSMRKSLAESASGIIAEFKRKSPSKGWIKADGQASVIPASYSRNGASALSILTDELYFGGHLDFIRQARPTTGLPILRKDFIIDEYQLYQARWAGADAVLLIAAALSPADCTRLTEKAHSLGLEVLLEIHSEEELEYVTAQPDMLGVNNRHLGTFHTDVENSFRIASLLPSEILLVSESGISQPDTVKRLRAAGFRGFLIGETFMRSDDPGQALHDFIQAVVS
ncbi:MAG: indole-3-glycerol phosphate synthase TrpC [Paraprevotella sp.]|nr:indole-3-glycerol phosphate synthase TrpC [Paraprevotella sp.]